MYPKTKVYESLRETIAEIPVIDCHDHTVGVSGAPQYKEPIASLIQGYFQSDLISAGAENQMGFLNNPNVSTEEKWPVFEKFWKRTEHTSYARVTKLILKNVYGEDKMSLEALKRISDKLLNLKDEKTYYGILEKADIKCRLVNIWIDLKKYIQGNYTLPEIDRMLVPLPNFHQSARSHGGIQGVAGIIDRYVTSLDEYLDACFEIFQKMKERGTIGMKDQSAYSRTLNFENATRSDAEKLFNFALEDPRRQIGWPEAKPLDDYLFHEFMRMAKKLDWPVQIHTGHMAGIRNDIVKTNAINFTSVLELHKDVKFDLFHGNWPYAGELLYLAKNFPNVHIDCCWVNIIDAYYTKKLFVNSIFAVPHSKIHAFGADYGDIPEYAAAHLEIARDVVASALAELVESSWLDEAEARQIAADWFFNNPNEFFNLGFEPVQTE